MNHYRTFLKRKEIRSKKTTENQNFVMGDCENVCKQRCLRGAYCIVCNYRIYASCLDRG